jgi:hypothetical protein
MYLEQHYVSLLTPVVLVVLRPDAMKLRLHLQYP